MFTGRVLIMPLQILTRLLMKQKLRILAVQELAQVVLWA